MRARGFWGAVVLVLAVEGGIRRHEASLAEFALREASLSGRAARGAAVGCRILAFGDSQVKLGILPRVLAAGTGRRAYNLAVSGSAAPASYFLLRRALAAGARPEAVVVDFNPYLLAYYPEPSLARSQGFLGFDECLEVAWTSRSARLFLVLTLPRWLPSLQHRRELRADLAAALRGTAVDRAGKMVDYLRQLGRHDGALVAPPRPPGPLPLDPTNRALCPLRWRCDPVNAAYLLRFLALAKAHGVAVFWLLPPWPPGVQEHRERAGSDAAYLRVVRAAQARFPTLVVIDGRHASYDEALFADDLHLDGRGAAALTAAVAAIVRRRLDGDAARWFELPGFRLGPAIAGGNDRDDPRIATRATSAGRRR